MATMWTLGERIEYENGQEAEVVYVDAEDPHYAVVRKGEKFEIACRERPVPPDDPSDDTWWAPQEDFDNGAPLLHDTLEAALHDLGIWLRGKPGATAGAA
jgi:hypothetical protein